VTATVCQRPAGAGRISHINLHINSPGGDVFEGIAIFNALKFTARQSPCISTVWPRRWHLIAMVGNPVIMPENIA
jgi:ATP-dependent protease ClpP protease subunit